jgi:hypothetical protein
MELRRLVRALPLLVLSLAAFSAETNPEPSTASASSSNAATPPQVAAPAPAAPAISPFRIGSLTVTGSIRTRLENWSWFDAAADSDYAYSGSTIRIGIGQSRRSFDWLTEFEAPVLLGLPDSSIAPAPQGQLGLGATYFAGSGAGRNVASIFLKQGFVRFKGLGGSDSHSLKLGRFEFFDGAEVAPKDPTLAALKRDRIAHRLLGNFGFTHVGRSYDGAQYVYQKGNSNLTVAGLVPTRGVFQVDGWGNLKISNAYAAFTRQESFGAANRADWRAFYWHYGDWRDGVVKVDDRPLGLRQADPGHISISNFGGHYLHSTATRFGGFDLLGWGVLQTGSWGNLAHRAGAAALEAGYQPTILRRLKPWIRAGWNYGSGDKEVGDNRHNTFFQGLPTPRIYARFPFFNMMNTDDRFVELIVRPSKRLTVRADAHALRLSDSTDLWYLGGGAFQPWTFGFQGRPSNGARSLANLYDVSADYVINPRSTLSIYVGYADAKSVARSVYRNTGNPVLAYVEWSFKF